LLTKEGGFRQPSEEDGSLPEPVEGAEVLSLYFRDFIVFKDKANDIIGIELDDFISYMVDRVSKSKLRLVYVL
jgi:hypothetical protein